jgi:predicted MFS family arabinose efflux permease
MIIGVRVAVTIQAQSVGALGPALLVDPGLELGYSGLGILIGAYSLPGILVALPSGWLAARLGERRMVLAGLALSVTGGLALAVAPDFALALAARLAAGAGVALLNVVLSAMVMARFTGSALAPAMGGFLAAYPFGIGLTLIALPALAAAALSWRIAMLAVAAGCALAAVPFLLTAGAPRATPGTEPRLAVEERRGSLLHPGEWAPLLAASAAWTSLNVGYAVLLGFAPALLAERGTSPEMAGALASLAGWACVPLAPIGGALAQRTGRPLLATTACLGVIAAAALALAAGVGPQSWALLAAGLLTSIPATVIMTLPARALAPESRAFGMGIYWTVYYAGMAVLPPLAGWAADGTGSAAAALGVSAAFCVSAITAVSVYSVLLARRARTRGAMPGRGPTNVARH